MRIRHSTASLLLLLIPRLHHTYAIRSSEQVAAALAEGKQLPKDEGPSPSVPSSLAKSNIDGSVGTKDAPVDGKDGRPHQGPFVETSAERDRKKAKESGDDEPAATAKKPPTTDKLKEASYKDGWKMELPETNDGVMDDPNRSGPKEGTRGTEGGISEKSRDGKSEGDSGLTRSEKKPDPPKEAPPLPHGEQEKLGSKDGKEPSKKVSEAKSPEIDDIPKEKSKELGGLEVRSLRELLLSKTLNRDRNLQISLKSRMIFLTLPQHRPPLRITLKCWETIPLQYPYSRHPRQTRSFSRFTPSSYPLP